MRARCPGKVVLDYCCGNGALTIQLAEFGAEAYGMDIYKNFRKRLSVVENKKTGFVTVGFDFIAPTFAKRWLDLMIADLNNAVRERDADDARRNIAYLERQNQQTQVAEVQRVLYQLLEEQAQILMLAQSREQYAFKIVDPPIVADEKIGPNRLLVCVAGGLVGLIAGAFAALVMSAWYAKKNRRRSSS